MLLLALLLSQTPQHMLFRQPNLPQGSALPFFSAFGADGLGTTSACSTTAPTGAKGEVLTGFARSTVAWCTNDDYSLTSLAAGVPRVMRGRSTGNLGMYVEELAGQNDFLHNRDLSQATTTKTDVTCAKTATGVDGVANSASTCTATGANGTALQAIVRASAANASSMYIRRRTGTGAVEVTRDNGTTYTAITSSLTTDWKRVVCLDAEGCMGGRCIVVADMCATSVNPTVGFRLVTSGDAVDVDLVQNESRAGPSSPITSGAAAGSRGAETGGHFALPVALATFGSVSVDVLATRANAQGSPVAGWQSNTNFILPWYAVGAGTISAQDLGCAFRPTSGLVSVGSGTFHPGGGAFPLSCAELTGAGGRRVCMGGYCATAVAGNAITGLTRILVGGSSLSGQPFNGIVSNICFAGPDDAVQCGPDRTTAKPSATHIVWLGDSITNGSVSAPTRPPYSLSVITAAASSRSVLNGGFGGDNVAAMKVRWDSYIKTQGWGTLVYLGGVNNLRVSGTAAATYATAAQVLDDAKARGMAVVVVGVLPWAEYTGWSAAEQVETDAYNALLSDWATANGETYVDTSVFGESVTDGGTGPALKAAYNSGDGLHPNAAGSQLLAETVAAALP